MRGEPSGAVGAGVKKGTLVRIVGTSACDITVLPADAELQAIPGLCGVVTGSVLPGAYGIEAGQSAVGDIYRWFERSLAPAKYTEDGRALYIGSRTVHLAPGMTAPESLQKTEAPEVWRERMLAKLKHKEE